MEIHVVISMIQYDCIQGADADIQFHQQGMNILTSVLTHSILHSCNILQIRNNMGLSEPSNICNLLLAAWRHTMPIHKCCLQYTFSTTDGITTYRFQQVNGFQFQDSESPPSGPVSKNSPPGIPSLNYAAMTLILATHPAEYSSMPAYANGFTKSNKQLHHLHTHSSTVNGFQLYMPHISMTNVSLQFISSCMNF